MSTLSMVFVLLAVVCLLAMIILLSVAARSVREVRSSIFPIVREEGTTRARRARLGATIAALAAAGTALAFLATGYASLPAAWPALPDVPLLAQLTRGELLPGNPTASLTPQLPPSPTQAANTMTPTARLSARLSMPSPTVTNTTTKTPALPSPTATPQPPTPTQPSATATGNPSGTPASSRVVATPTMAPSPTPKGSSVPAPREVRMGPIAFAAAVDDGRMAVNPTGVFSETVSRVYAVFPFSGMEKGLSWTQVWYFNGAEFMRDKAVWQWGIEDRSYVFIKPVGAGEYRLDMYVNDQVLTSGKFRVLGPTAIGGPQNP